MQLADRCRLDADKLREHLEHLRAHPPAERPARRRTRGASEEAPPHDDPEDDDTDTGPGAAGLSSGGPDAVRAGPGLEALKLAVHRPEETADRVHAVLFTDPVQRHAFVALLEHDSVHDAVEAASPEVANLLRRVIVEEPMAGDPELGDPVDSVLTVMLRGAARLALADLEKQSRGGGDSWQATAAETAQVRRWLDQLDDPANGRDAADRLVVWLSQREPEG